MPNTPSAKKSLRQSAKRRLVNVSKKKGLKQAIKEYRNMIADKKIDDAAKFLPTVYKKLDKSVKTNLIKKNTASRLKSRLTKSLSKNK
ncbi:MAG: 30S ribosomal protein S20 [bacterium]|nr:30S ribosomal protein S20 [bacterium]